VLLANGDAKAVVVFFQLETRKFSLGAATGPPTGPGVALGEKAFDKLSN
jgi:hypothetical protein